MSDDTRESVFHFQHILVPVPVVVLPVSAVMSAAMTVAMVVYALVVSVAVGVVSMQGAMMLVSSHNVTS